MSKCLICGNELLSGDMHWERGTCNACWNKTFNKDLVAGIDLIDIYKDKISILEHQLAEKDKEISKLSREHLEMFGDMKTYKNLWLAEQRKNKEIRKQICDEIREKLKKQIIPAAGTWLSYYDITETNNLLDQIEQIVED